MSVYSTCAFCGRNDSPRSREHVFADWIAREFPPDWIRRDAATGKSISLRNTLGLVCRRVCQRCNNGWMRELESAAKPILTSLIHATRRTPLTLNDQIKIARWFTKTSYAYDLTQKRSRESWFTADDRLALATKHFIKRDTAIFIAQYVGAMATMTAMEDSGLHRPKNQQLPSTGHWYCHTVLINHLALQIFTFRRAEHLAGEELGFGIPVIWDRAALQLCLGTRSLDWPPATCLDDRNIKTFAARFSSGFDIALKRPL